VLWLLATSFNHGLYSCSSLSPVQCSKRKHSCRYSSKGSQVKEQEDKRKGHSKPQTHEVCVARLHGIAQPGVVLDHGVSAVQSHLITSKLLGKRLHHAHGQLAQLSSSILIRDDYILNAADLAALVDELLLNHEGCGPNHLVKRCVFNDSHEISSLCVLHLVKPVIPLVPGNVPHRGQLRQELQEPAVIVLSTEWSKEESFAGVLDGQLGVELGAGGVEVHIKEVGAEQVVLNHLRDGALIFD